MQTFNSLDKALQDENFCKHLDDLDLHYCYDALSYSSDARYNLYNELIAVGENPFTNLRYIPVSMLSDSNVGYNVNIPDTVQSIGEYAFCNCNLLKEVNIGENVEEIGYSAFSSCGILQHVHLPSRSGLSIRGCAFEDCFALKKIILDKNIEYLGPSVFSGCTDLVIKFRGTEEEFSDIEKHKNWNPNQCPIEYEYKGD